MDEDVDLTSEEGNARRADADSGGQESRAQPHMGVTDSGSAVGDLYEYWTLDLLMSLGPYCAEAFEAQPQRFKAVAGDIASTLAAMKYRAGKDELHLSDEGRSALVGRILGSEESTASGQSGFQEAARGVRMSAAAFVERSFDTGERQLREAFRDSEETLREYITAHHKRGCSGGVIAGGASVPG